MLLFFVVVFSLPSSGLFLLFDSIFFFFSSSSPFRLPYLLLHILMRRTGASGVYISCLPFLNAHISTSVPVLLSFLCFERFSVPCALAHCNITHSKWTGVTWRREGGRERIRERERQGERKGEREREKIVEKMKEKEKKGEPADNCRNTKKHSTIEGLFQLNVWNNFRFTFTLTPKRKTYTVEKVKHYSNTNIFTNILKPYRILIIQNITPFL